MFPDVIRTAHRAALAAYLCLGPVWADPTPGELLALRYYLERGDSPAAAAELRRLRIIHPDWTPPKDPAALFRPVVAGDEVTRIYDLIARGSFEEARSAIGTLEARLPGWRPPGEMLRLLREGAAQEMLDAAASKGLWPQVIAAARQAPEILSCERINNLWLLAEAQDQTGVPELARATYGGILDRCNDPAALIATLEKAEPLLDDVGLRAFTTRAAERLPTEEARFAAARDRLLAGRARTVPDLPPERAVSAAEAASAQPAPDSVSPKDARWAAVFAAARAGRWADCLSASRGAASPDLRRQRGWCALSADRPLEAVALFRGLQGVLSGAGARDVAHGLGLALVAADMPEAALDHLAAVRLDPNRAAEVRALAEARRAVRAFDEGRFADAIVAIAAAEAASGARWRDLDLMRAEALRALGREGEARRLLRGLNEELSTSATRAALARN